MDPTRNPAEDADFDFAAWARWQHLQQAWQRVAAARQLAVHRPEPAEPPLEPEIVYLLPVPN